MTEFHGPPLDRRQIPDDVTIAEFMLDYRHPLRPAQGTAPCLIEDATGRRVYLHELREQTLALAQALSEKYKIVLICSPNHVDYPAAIWAPQYLGAIFTGANPNCTPDELVYQIKLTGTTLIIAHSDSIETARKAGKLAGISPDRVLILDSDPKLDATSVATLISGSISAGSTFVQKKLRPGEGKTKVAALYMSSGTTGPQKVWTTRKSGSRSNQLVLNVDSHVMFSPGDVVLSLLPFFHVAGVFITTLVVIPKFSLVGMLDSIARHRMQHLVYVLLLTSPVVKKYDLSKLKYIACGAAPMTSELQDQLSQLCPQATIGQCYGQNSTQFTSPGAGTLLPGVQARVVKSDGTLAGYNEPGEFVIKSPSLALEYYKNREASDEAFIADRWFRTGDEVKITENGELFITGRLKELIKVRGFQVSPVELEGLILNHPDVSDACVLGVPDDFSGEVPRAYVVLTEAAAKKARNNPEPIKASIAKLVADNKVKYKHLAGGVVFVPLIPKNPSGKIMRRVLKEQVKEQAKAKL
ncbi:amp dependent CoA ligase [Mycena albidolilacea]|uniref:Amp dependent CoA ligase n=1 Tax=Mycena albidolilacea TaxID=1033008 RepID=A0AAD7ARL5_9AGAR|nr:amp dependent CoA ligase [Mycena albidolilacea]